MAMIPNWRQATPRSRASSASDTPVDAIQAPGSGNWLSRAVEEPRRERLSPSGSIWGGVRDSGGLIEVIKTAKKKERQELSDEKLFNPVGYQRYQANVISAEDYAALTPEQQGAVRFNTGLNAAREADRAAVVPDVDSDQATAYQATYEKLFGDQPLTYAPNTLALIESLGVEKPGKFDDYLNLSKSIDAEEYAGLLGDKPLTAQLAKEGTVDRQIAGGYDNPRGQDPAMSRLGTDQRINSLLASGANMLTKDFNMDIFAEQFSGKISGASKQYGGIDWAPNDEGEGVKDVFGGGEAVAPSEKDIIFRGLLMAAENEGIDDAEVARQLTEAGFDPNEWAAYYAANRSAGGN